MPEIEPQEAPRTRRGEVRRREILRVARSVFSEKGFADTSMAEIAAKVGVVEGALYKHFSSKRELLFEAVRDHLEPRFRKTRDDLEGISGIRNRVRFVVYRHIREFVDEPGVCRLIIQDIRPTDEYRGSALWQLIREHTTLLATVLREAERGGNLRAGVDSAVVRDLVYGGIEHLTFRALAGRGSVDSDRIADQVTDLVLGGVGGDATPTSELARLQKQIDRLERLVGELGRARGKKGAS